MTAPNLTPAEALECLRSWDDTTVEWDAWACRYSNHLNGGPDEDACLRRRCFKIIGEALSEHEATKAKLAAYEAKGDYHEEYRRVVAEHLKWERSVRDDDAAKLHKLMARQEPAAAVPSDEEIAKAIRKADSTTTPYAVGYLTEAIEMLAKRIGVKL